MYPGPFRVLVMFSVFDPVSMMPLVMFTVAAVTLLCKINSVPAPVVLLVRILNVVAPDR